MSTLGHDYEITFLVAGLTDDCIDCLYEQLDCLAGDDFEGREFVTVTCNGQDAFTAAKTMITTLQCAGLTVQTTLLDLVTRSEIADRTETTRQGVANWVNGTRGANFPPAISSAGGGVWLWADVHRWLVENKKHVRGAHLRYPTASEHERINVYLHQGARDVLGETSAKARRRDDQRWIRRYEETPRAMAQVVSKHV